MTPSAAEGTISERRIVCATEADLPRIAELAGVVWRAHYPGIITHQQIEYMLARMYDIGVMRDEMGQGIAYECLWAKDALVAFASYGAVGQEEMKLYKLYVDPAWQRHGCGTQLLHHIEEVCRQRNFKNLCLTVNKRNQKAIAAYRKNGFTTRESIVVDIGGGFVMDDYVMAKAV